MMEIADQVPAQQPCEHVQILFVRLRAAVQYVQEVQPNGVQQQPLLVTRTRSEERRVGLEYGSRSAPATRRHIRQVSNTDAPAAVTKHLSSIVLRHVP